MSSCIFRDGILLAGCAEERFSRIKRDPSFPHNAIQFCLKEAGITFSELNSISVGWNPAFYMEKKNNVVLKALKDKGMIIYHVINELGSAEYTDSLSNIDQNLFFKDGSKIPIEFIDHHFAHASYAFHNSGYESALTVVLDGFGEIHTGGFLKWIIMNLKLLLIQNFHILLDYFILL